MLRTTRRIEFLETVEAAERSIDQILTALDDRWQITEPVYRGLCDDTGYTTADYYFVLRRDAVTSLRIVPGCEDVRQFLRDRQLKTVDAFHVVPVDD